MPNRELQNPCFCELATFWGGFLLIQLPLNHPQSGKCSQLTPSSVFLIENKFLHYLNTFSHIWKCVIIGKVQIYKKKSRKMPLSIIWYFNLVIIIWFLFLAIRYTTCRFSLLFYCPVWDSKYFPYHKKLHTQNQSLKIISSSAIFVVPGAYDTYFIKRYLWASFFKLLCWCNI